MQTKEEPDNITKCILTNQNDHKDTCGSSRSRPGTLDIHEGRAEDGNDYADKIPNCHKLGSQDTLQHHNTYQPQWPPEPSGMIPEPLSHPVTSEASEIPSSLPTSLSLLPKKDDTEPNASLMYTERHGLSWNLSLAPTKKNGRDEPEDKLEMREGIGPMRGVVSPCLEFGGGTWSRVAPPD